jgi:hypothetical protein
MRRKLQLKGRDKLRFMYRLKDNIKMDPNERGVRVLTEFKRFRTESRDEIL